MTAFAAAALRLHLAALDHGERTLRDVEVVLCEDGRSVMIYAAAGDNWVCVSFDLPETEAFNAQTYINALAPESMR